MENEEIRNKAFFDVPSFITGGVDIEEIASDHLEINRLGFSILPQFLPSLSSPWRVYHEDLGDEI